MRVVTKRPGAARVFLPADQVGNPSGSFTKVNLTGVEYVRGSGLVAVNGGLLVVEAGVYEFLAQLSMSGASGTTQFRLMTSIGGNRGAIQATMSVAPVVTECVCQPGETIALEGLTVAVWTALSGAANTWLSGRRTG